MTKPKDIIEQHEEVESEGIEEDRGHDLKRVMVDVTKRENPDGTHNLLVLMYVRPDVNPSTVRGPIQETTKEIFGKKRNPDYYECFFRPKGEFEFELESGERGNFPVFDIRIKHPKSAVFDMNTLRKKFTKTLYKKLEDEDG